MSPVTATAVRFHEYGEPQDVLREERVEVANPAAGHVRVRVSAVGLNPADWELCRGFMAGSLPRGIGYDVAGTVDAVGDDVEDVAIGDLVFGTADFVGQPSAGVADIAILNRWYRVPDGLDPVEAAVLPMAVQTATWTLDAMGLEPGTMLLVNGAGATVGFAAVQIALRRGARVIATAGPTFAGELTTFGALVTPYGEGMADRVRDLAGEPIDLVFDAPPPNAGSIPELIAIAGEPSRVMTISNHDEARRLGARVNLDHLAGLAPPETFMSQYAALAADGAFRIPIARTYRSPIGGTPSSSACPATPRQGRPAPRRTRRRRLSPMLDFPELDGPLRRMTRPRAADAISAASTATSKRISANPAGRHAGTRMPIITCNRCQLSPVPNAPTAGHRYPSMSTIRIPG